MAEYDQSSADEDLKSHQKTQNFDKIENLEQFWKEKNKLNVISFKITSNLVSDKFGAAYFSQNVIF